MIEEGKKVKIEYTLKVDDGTTIGSSEGKEPLEYTHGQGQILPALEKALEGLDVGDTVKVKIAPEDGYGPVIQEAFQEVEPHTIPQEARVAGSLLIAEGTGGKKRPVRVHAVHDDKIVLDFNHPLAGQNLNFEVRIVAIA